MTHISENGKYAAVMDSAQKEAPALEPHDLLEFQIYPGTNSRKQSKDKVKYICNIARGIAAKFSDEFEGTRPNKYPLETREGVEALIEALNDGFAVHFGITSKSTKVADIEGFYGCFVDYNAYDKKTVCCCLMQRP
jgi:hypothetical protein